MKVFNLSSERVAASFATEWLFSGMRFIICHKNVLLHQVQLNGFSPM